MNLNWRSIRKFEERRSGARLFARLESDDVKIAATCPDVKERIDND